MADDPKKQQKSTTERIISTNIVPEMRESYLDYAMSVIVSRALPDVRDGLKPVHRRILYSMHELGLTHQAKFRKSAAVVGDVLGKYHPHGDTSVYDAMVKMAQDFYMRYPLVEGQGNFGSVDGDSAAAMRYTEARMSRLSSELLRDIEKGTVDFAPNYDATRNEPTVLPSAVPNLLLNGTVGIAVGMASKIPPHNLRELIDALVYRIDNPDATTEDLLKYVKGPDFPTGGIAYNRTDIHHAYATGRGGVVVRGEAEIVEEKAGSFHIIINSLPYQVNKAEMITGIADQVREKKLEGVRDIRDESTKETRVVIELKQGVNPQKVLNYLYKHSPLETTFNYNMVTLVDGIPRTLSLGGVLEEFLKYRRVVVTRRTKYDLSKAEDREHILSGLKKALDHIDEVIKTIKGSSDTPTAHANLMKKFALSDRQATAILDMRLQKLAGLERKKIEDELEEVRKLIVYLKDLLAHPEKILAVIKTEFKEIAERYGDDRRTRIVRQGVKEITEEDLVPEAENVLVLTAGGYVKRTDPSEYRAQRRGGIGVVDLDIKEEDFITIFLTANTHDDLLFFTDSGRAYQIKMYDLPEGRRATRGKSIMNFLSLTSDDRVTSVLPMPKVTRQKDLSLVMVTRMGVIKKVSAANFRDVRRNGLAAIRLDDGDQLLSAFFAEKGDTVILATANGQSIRFKESDVREMGRAAGGVRAITLKKGDSVVGAEVITADYVAATFMIMSENGYGKRTALPEYKVQKRAGSGIKTANVTSKTGKIMVARVVTDTVSEFVAISKNGQVIRTGMAEVPVLGRQTQGVRIMKLREKDTIASLTLL
ncbi:MAG: DNA gyrase subunit A [Candidatus Vogelbacteria bacterium]|nr:DNA gyrase subunit A [Candidatus Vogelbacteria bacterium]